MTDAYATLAAGGIHRDPVAIEQGRLPRRPRRPARERRSRERVLSRGGRLGGDPPAARQHHRRHRHRRLHRLRRPGRQDRDDRRIHRRLVRRLPAEPGDRGLGRLPGVERRSRCPACTGSPSSAAPSRPKSGTRSTPNGGVPCEEFDEPEQQISWAPYYGRFAQASPSDDGSVDGAWRRRAKTANRRRAAPRSAATTRTPTRPAPARNRRRSRRPRTAPGRRRRRRRVGGGSQRVARIDPGLAFGLSGPASSPTSACSSRRRGSGARLVWARSPSSSPPSRWRRCCSPTTSTATSTTPGSASSTASTPTSTPPDAVPADPAFADVTWTEATSAYGPLFTLATYPLAWLPVGAAVAVLKAVAALSVLGLAAVVARLAAWRGVDPLRAAAFVALNPLVLVHVVGGAHNDGLTMLLAMLAVAALLAAPRGGRRRRPRRRRRDQGLRRLRRPLRPRSRCRAPARRRDEAGHAGGARPVGSSPGGSRRRSSASPPTSPSAGTGSTRFGLAGENQGRTSHMSIPITFARLTGLDPDAGPRSPPRSSTPPPSPTSSPGPGAAATGSAPPPGPPSASSSPPPGSSPGT